MRDIRETPTGWWEPPRQPPVWRSEPKHPPADYAGFWRRFIAVALDGLLVGIPSWTVQEALAAQQDRAVDVLDGAAAISAWLALVVLPNLLIGWLYHAGMTSSRWQGSLGKQVLGVVVTDLAGRRVSFARASARHFATYLSTAIFLAGYLVQPFTARRQALHDVLAGTLVVRARRFERGAALVVPEPTSHSRGGIPVWAVGLSAGALLLLVGCGALVALRVWPALEEAVNAGTDAVASEVASVIERQVGGRITGSGVRGGQLNLYAADLYVNNIIMEVEGSIVEVGPHGVFILGFDTRIDASGLELLVDGAPVYRALPAVEDGRLEFVPVEEPVGLAQLTLPTDALERGLEDGINAALARHGLRATGVALGSGVLTLSVEPVPPTATTA